MASRAPGPGLLGTRLRHLLDRLDGDVAAVYEDLGLRGFRPRFTPIIRALASTGPSSIRDLAKAIGVTHSAASQTVAHMVKADLLLLAPGEDARQRIAYLTAKADALLPTLDAEWTATTAAAVELEAELSFPLSRLVDEALDALHRRPMRQRIADAAPHLVKHPRGGDAPAETARS
ncbi:MarR family winged helix-turn-helix transcriptional regulator [Rhizohabitans arisaemae]|uniref:MarR family winged helix-turn-helix transcriptional regulator n=1 Tax=Rhizohabitans arisaemae TaxID=2720610 RepID=UPI0024B16F87|nr:helix-turn-helix domain-containing protein [Rhizohabitans arisaemae]